MDNLNNQTSPSPKIKGLFALLALMLMFISGAGVHLYHALNQPEPNLIDEEAYLTLKASNDKEEAVAQKMQTQLHKVELVISELDSFDEMWLSSDTTLNEQEKLNKNIQLKENELDHEFQELRNITEGTRSEAVYQQLLQNLESVIIQKKELRDQAKAFANNLNQPVIITKPNRSPVWKENKQELIAQMDEKNKALSRSNQQINSLKNTITILRKRIETTSKGQEKPQLNPTTTVNSVDKNRLNEFETKSKELFQWWKQREMKKDKPAKVVIKYRGLRAGDIEVTQDLKALISSLGELL